MNTSLLETLESRQLMAGNPYLDSGWASGGVSTLAFRTFAGDASITKTQVVFAANGSTYVMARTNTTVQVRQLAGNGTANTGFGKNGILLVPVAGQTSSAKIAADTTGNLILLADKKIYRFDGQGKTLNANFAEGGVLTLGSFSGNIDMSVDAANKIYVTGKTKGGDGILVERFISRGKRDRTFNNSGQVVVPLPRAYRNLENQVADGRFVQVIKDNTPNDTTDDRILVAGDATASNYDGVELAKLNYDGTLDTSYGTGGIQYLLSQKSNEANRYTVDIRAVSETGRVSVSATATENPGLGGLTTEYNAIYFTNGTPFRKGSFIAGVLAPNNTEVDLTSNGLLYRTQLNQALLTLPNADLTKINAIARYADVDDDGQALLVTSIAAKAGRVNVVKTTPSYVAVLA